MTQEKNANFFGENMFYKSYHRSLLHDPVPKRLETAAT
jgi:hypothetical protein